MWNAHPAEQLKGLVPDDAQAVRLHGVIVSDPTPVPPRPQRPPEDAVTCLVRVRDRYSRTLRWTTGFGRP